MVLQRFCTFITGQSESYHKYTGTTYNSHKPNICVLIDVGTKPSTKSIYYLWKTFDLNSNVGGACGEIAAYKGKNWMGLLNPLGMSLSVLSMVQGYKLSSAYQSPLRISNIRSRIFWTNQQNRSSDISVSWCGRPYYDQPAR